MHDQPLSSSLFASQDPGHHSEAMETTEWLWTMQSEMSDLQLNQTCTLVPSPVEHNIVSCKWLFHTKFCANGSIESYKERLVT